MHNSVGQFGRCLVHYEFMEIYFVINHNPIQIKRSSISLEIKVIQKVIPNTTKYDSDSLTAICTEPVHMTKEVSLV